MRAYIDTFFLDGSLTPVERENAAKLPAWVQTGVIHDPKADAVRRFRGLRGKFEAELPTADASHRDWQQAAQRWAELVVLRWEWDEALDAADRTAWADSAGEGRGRLRPVDGEALRLAAQPAVPPAAGHGPPHLPLPGGRADRKKLPKIALLVLDGLAFDQWLLLRKNLEACDKAWRFQESTAFAWVPTLTSVTRQSIFAGEPPLYFPDSFETTSKEQNHWLRFWEDQGVQRDGVELVTNIDGADDPKLEAALANPRLAVLGVVWNKVDDIMHGMQMQTAGMHLPGRDCGPRRAICNDCSLRLHDEGFAVYLTADHGNVTATGIGNPREGVLAETKGKRVRVYDRTGIPGGSRRQVPGVAPLARTTACPRPGTSCWLAT